MLKQLLVKDHKNTLTLMKPVLLSNSVFFFLPAIGIFYLFAEGGSCRTVLQELVAEVIGKTLQADALIYVFPSTIHNWREDSRTLRENMLRLNVMGKITIEPECRERFRNDKGHTGPLPSSGTVTMNQKKCLICSRLAVVPRVTTL